MTERKIVENLRLTSGESHFEVPYGISVQECLGRCFGLKTTSLVYEENPVVALLVNNDLLPYSARLTTDASLELLPLFSDLGKRMYRHTLSYLLSMASQQLFPERRLVIGHSLGNGYYFTYDGLEVLESRDIDRLRKRVTELVAQKLDIEWVEYSYQVALDYFLHVGYKATATLLDYRNDPKITLVRCGDYLDISYEPLLPNTSLMSLWELMPYGERGMLMRYPLSKNRFLSIEPFVDRPNLFAIFKEYKQWGKILNVDCLGAMNKICGSEDIATFIRMNEDLQHRKISAIADMIVAKKSAKMVFIAGPSSSGKTTFAKRLSIQLRLLGFNPVQISLDNYYLPKSQVPRDEEGLPDLETIEALDLELFRQNLTDLYAGKAISLPIFEFTGDGKRSFSKQQLQLNPQTILVIEGLHGLNPQLIPEIDEEVTFKIFISALTQLNLDDHNRISTTDNRILRRIVRDHRTRSTSAEGTLTMWPSVERGEARYNFPYQNLADVMINSALEYELAVLKPYVEPLLKTVKPQSHDAYPTARRLLTFLENVYPIPSNLVPSDSLLREFIGDSEFD